MKPMMESAAEQERRPDAVTVLVVAVPQFLLGWIGLIPVVIVAYVVQLTLLRYVGLYRGTERFDEGDGLPLLGAGALTVVVVLFFTCTNLFLLWLRSARGLRLWLLGAAAFLAPSVYVLLWPDAWRPIAHL